MSQPTNGSRLRAATPVSERSRLSRRTATAAAGVVLALALTSACSSGDGGSDEQGASPSGGAGADGAAGKAPKFTGAAIPGLADRPAWSVAGDRAHTLAWTAGGRGPTVFTAHDPAGGRLISQGPTTAPGVGVAEKSKAGVALSVDGTTAVVALTKGAVAWDTGTGAKLWEQAKDERQLRPVAISPQGVLYALLEGSGIAALDVRSTA